MYLEQKVNYDCHKLDAFDNGITTLTRRRERGTVTFINEGTGWVKVTLDSGIEVFMSEFNMKIACGL